MRSDAPASSQPTALVTGGARRIGAAIVRTLADAGYAVAIHVRTSGEAAEALAAAIAAKGGRAVIVTGDLASATAAPALVAQAADAIGPLSLLVNNAAVFEDDAVGRLDAAVWDRHFAVNLRAPVLLAEAFAAQAGTQTDPSVVNIGDQRAAKLVPRQFSYTLAKAALHAATTMLAQALSPAVRVNAVAPGPTLPSPRQDAGDFSAQSAALPLGCGPSPDAIAQATLFLARARHVTGETIAVDGGQHIAWRTPDVGDFPE